MLTGRFTYRFSGPQGLPAGSYGSELNDANPQSIASTPRKQQPVAQSIQKPRVGTAVRRTWSGIPGSASQPQWATDALAKVENAKKKKLNGLP